MQDSEGNRLQGTVDEIRMMQVVIILTIPLPGDLHFTGSVVSVREATMSELTNGLYGEKSSCSSGSCSGCSGCH